MKTDDKIIDKIIEKELMIDKRAQKLRLYLKDRDFDSFIGRIIREHDNQYFDKCYLKGKMPHPNNKFELLLKLVEIEGEIMEDVDFVDTSFPSTIIKYENYFFQEIFGQGTIIRIFDKHHELLFQI